MVLHQACQELLQGIGRLMARLSHADGALSVAGAPHECSRVY